jgi:hypothetical protein
MKKTITLQYISMKNLSKVNPLLRNDRSTWLTVAAILAGCALGANAATISEHSTVPNAPVLSSQLTDLGPGSQDNGRDYANNVGPVGQTFQVASGGLMSSLSILGRGDSASQWTSGPQPFDGTEVWGIQIGSVNANGSIFVLDSETATGFAGPANIANYLTFTLANPVALSEGATYCWSINITNVLGGQDNTAWFGFAHSTANAYANGTAFNNNTTTADPEGPGNNQVPAFGGFVAPNAANYDYVFAVQGVPEPTTLALIGLGGLGLIAANRRRRA